MTLEPSKMSGYSKHVGLIGEHLLDAQRPLLVPRAGQTQCLVPSRKLDCPCARVASQGDGERLEHDALHVVLGLGLGEAQRVDLHAVAEAQVALIAHAVALTAELLPEDRHRA